MFVRMAKTFILQTRGSRRQAPLPCVGLGMPPFRKGGEGFIKREVFR